MGERVLNGSLRGGRSARRLLRSSISMTVGQVETGPIFSKLLEFVVKSLLQIRYSQRLCLEFLRLHGGRKEGIKRRIKNVYEKLPYCASEP